MGETHRQGTCIGTDIPRSQYTPYAAPCSAGQVLEPHLVHALATG